MKNEDQIKQMAIEAIRICNLFVSDLLIGTRCVEDAIITKIGFKRDTVIGAYKRMCYSHIIITLAKWIEVYDRYKAVIPKDCKYACLNLKKKINNCGIKDFRDKYVGHIWNDDTRRPLTPEEIRTYINKIGLDEKTFSKWVNNPANNSFSKTVIGTVEHTRDMIMKEYDLAQKIIFPGLD